MPSMSPKGAPREKKFTMLLSDDENAKLTELAEAEGLSAATWLRRVILAQHAELAARRGSSKTRKPKK
jgi:hypothetical protein